MIQQNNKAKAVFDLDWKVQNKKYAWIRRLICLQFSKRESANLEARLVGIPSLNTEEERGLGRHEVMHLQANDWAEKFEFQALVQVHVSRLFDKTKRDHYFSAQIYIHTTFPSFRKSLCSVTLH